MKWLNKLNDKEIKELYKKVFLGKDEELKELKIDKQEDIYTLWVTTLTPEWEDDMPDEMVEMEDYINITDFFVPGSYNCDELTKKYRMYMYEKFGNEYAKDFLFENL